MSDVEKMTLYCNYCGRAFKRHPSLVLAGRRTFCGQVSCDAARPVHYDREEE